MLLSVEDGLIKVGDAPALGDIETEQGGEHLGRLAGERVAPSQKGVKLVPLRVKSQITVHHARNADAPHRRQRQAEPFPHIALQGPIAGLQAPVHIRQVIGPHAADQLIFPSVAAGSHRLEALVQQDGLDTGRAQLQAKDSAL